MRRDGDVGMKTLEENVPPDHRPDQGQSAQHLFPHRPVSARARFPQYPWSKVFRMFRYEQSGKTRGGLSVTFAQFRCYATFTDSCAGKFS